jgi:hypothetical protein
VQLAMSALGQKRTHAVQQTAPSFEHFVSEREQRRLACTARPRWCLLSDQFGFEHLHTRYTHCERHTAEALAKSFGQIVTSSFLRHWTIIGTNSVLRPV